MRRGRKYEAIGVAHIGTLLAEAIGDAGRVREALGVWPAWEQAVGPQIAAAARPVSLRNGVLTVHVRHAVWLQELGAQRETLLRRVRRVASAASVTQLKFRVGALPAMATTVPVALPPPSDRAAIPYDLARAIRGIPAQGLRGVLLRVAARWSALGR